MKESELFYKFYDTLFSSKDYPQEIDVIFDISANYGLSPIENILDIGCGTGNHTIELAKRNISVSALDIDENMLKIARQKFSSVNYKNIKFSSGFDDSIETDHFDLAIALFNVVTYIENYSLLKGLLSNIKNILRPGGLFIFDC